MYIILYITVPPICTGIGLSLIYMGCTPWCWLRGIVMGRSICFVRVGNSKNMLIFLFGPLNLKMIIWLVLTPLCPTIRCTISLDYSINVADMHNFNQTHYIVMCLGSIACVFYSNLAYFLLVCLCVVPSP